MSERIIIRAWDKTHKIMRYNYCGNNSDVAGRNWVIFHPEYDNSGNITFGGFNSPYPFEQFILMLASSVKDVDGKFIYAFDIIQDLRGNIFFVVFDGVKFFVRGDATDKELTSTKWQVVGNVFEYYSPRTDY